MLFDINPDYFKTWRFDIILMLTSFTFSGLARKDIPGINNYYSHDYLLCQIPLGTMLNWYC